MLSKTICPNSIEKSPYTRERTFTNLSYIILQITPKLLYVLIQLYISEVHSQTIHVSGNISTDSTPLCCAELIYPTGFI